MIYASLQDLLDRLDWEPDADELRVGTSALEDATELAIIHGREWPQSTVPRLVRALVLKAATRYLRNPSGYTQSRAGDETLSWSDAHGRDAGSVHFTREEIRLLEGIAGRKPGLTSVVVSSWGTKLRPKHVGRVPVDYAGDSFPMFSDEMNPW
ncbi:hypothetical protein GT042_04900 [Streptomyces sp. SID3212]|nr:hypothetical protein [Streptomyces sp. SID3212]